MPPSPKRTLAQVRRVLYSLGQVNDEAQEQPQQR